MPPRKVGRPPKFEEPEKQELVSKFERYIEENDLPIIAEFAAQNGLWKSYFYDHPEFANLIKIATTKKEGALERGALTRQYDTGMSAFSLKQLGWRDKEAKIVFVDPKTLSDEELKKLISEG